MFFKVFQYQKPRLQKPITVNKIASLSFIVNLYTQRDNISKNEQIPHNKIFWQ